MPKGIYQRKPLSQAHRDAIGLALRRRGPNAGAFKKGERRSPETQFKKGMPATAGSFKKGDLRLMGHAWLGGGHPKGSKPVSLVHDKPHTEEAKARMRVINRANAKRGEASCHWKGGTGTARHREMVGWRYKEWRRAVFQRDAHTCRRCGAGWRTWIHADHVVAWADDPSLRYDVANGLTLCYRCHFAKTFGWYDAAAALSWGVPRKYRKGQSA